MNKLALAIATMAFASGAHAQAVDFTKADLEKMVALGPVDHQGRVVDAGKLVIGISVVNRATLNKPADAPVVGLIDTQISKVYTIVAGSGTLTTGGKILDAKPAPDDPAATTPVGGKSLTGVNEGGISRVVGVGDMIIIPAGGVRRLEAGSGSPVVCRHPRRRRPRAAARLRQPGAEVATPSRCRRPAWWPWSSPPAAPR